MWIFPKEFSIVDGDTLYSNRPINADLIISFDESNGIEMPMVSENSNANSGHHVVHEVPDNNHLSILSKFPSIEFLTSIANKSNSIIKLYWCYKSITERDEELKKLEEQLKKS